MNANTNENTTTIVVHIRRGDYLEAGRKVLWDETYMALIEKLRAIVERTGKTPQVHIFSEDYGSIAPYKDGDLPKALNWSLYDGIVDPRDMHLAPDMRESKKGLKTHKARQKANNVMDMSLNLRDWRHFVEADIWSLLEPSPKYPHWHRPNFQVGN